MNFVPVRANHLGDSYKQRHEVKFGSCPAKFRSIILNETVLVPLSGVRAFCSAVERDPTLSHLTEPNKVDFALDQGTKFFHGKLKISKLYST
jgi:hypothetical protein